MLRARLGALAPLAPWGYALALAASVPAAGCGSGGSSGPGGGGNGGSGGAAGDSGTDAGPVCGDGTISGNEECDNGASNAPGSGCEPDCHTSCHADADCDDSEPCNGVETCQSVPGGRACKPGTPPADGSACGTGGYCKNAVCTQPQCGNGAVEPGEDCEPPGTATCALDCKTVVCGDGVIAGNEQCDDGNTKNLDGCDSNCRYETVMRLSRFEITRDPAPGFCTHQGNAVGQSFSTEVAQAFDDNITATITGGAYNEFFSFGGLDDLTGTDASNFELAMVSGSLDPKYFGTWSPTTPDEWYLADTDLLDPKTDKPTELLAPAMIKSNELTAGPSSLLIRIITGTTVSEFDSRDTSIDASIDTSPAPNAPKPPPSALASGLAVFQSLTATATDQGLCGVATVASLATTPLPQDFCLGPNACQDSTTCTSGTRTYTYCGAGLPVGPGCNSLLDVIVGGCKVTSLCVEAVTPTQPDVGTGGNAPAKLTLGTSNKVTPSVPTDGYTFFAHFAASRAHLTNNLP
jgi:cysteine-rich repeat protein